MSCNDIGKRLKKLREERKLTQQKLADALYTTRENINYWENGQRDIKSQTIVQLAKYFEVSCDYLLTGVSAEHIETNEKLSLSENSINNILEVNKYYKNTLDLMLSNDFVLFFVKSVFIFLDKSGKYEINLFEDIDVSNILNEGYKSLCHTQLDNLLNTLRKENLK